MLCFPSQISKICGEDFMPASQKFGLATQEEFEESGKVINTSI